MADSVQELNEQALWQAVMRRDASYSGVFYFGVKTTGVFCRPGCPSPLPKRGERGLAFSPVSLAQAGFRPCRRCRPDEAGAAGHSVGLVVETCRVIEQSDGIRRRLSSPAEPV
jgi:AraC family transcriptional regulator of adaptative response/methylated-DNA-[protein]-cysteine methyltransferase